MEYSLRAKAVHAGCTALLGCTLSMQVTAAEAIQKLDFINTGRVYQESKQAQTIQRTLGRELSRRRAALQELQQEGLKLEKQPVESKMQGAEHGAAAREWSDLVRKFRKQQAQFAEDYDLHRDRELAVLQNNTNCATVQLTKKGGYGVILQGVIYVSSKFDTTSGAIRTMNAH